MKEKRSPNPLVQSAIAIAGGTQESLAKACNVTQAAVQNWLNRDDRLSLNAAIKIEIATKGAITRQQLRPDVQWHGAGQ